MPTVTRWSTLPTVGLTHSDLGGGAENAGPENAGPENEGPSRNAATLCK